MAGFTWLEAALGMVLRDGEWLKLDSACSSANPNPNPNPNPDPNLQFWATARGRVEGGIDHNATSCPCHRPSTH